MRSGAQRIATRAAQHELWLVAVVVPVLVLAPSPALPSWLVNLALCAVPVPFLARRLAYGRFSVKTPQDMPLLLLLIMHGIGAAVTADMSLTMLVIQRTAVALAIFYFLINNLQTEGQIVAAAAVLIGAGLAMAGVGLLGMNWFSNRILPQELLQRLPHADVAGLDATGFHPNIVGGSLAMVVPVGLGLAATRRGVSRLVCLLACIALLVVLVLSQSRGALLGLAVALGVMALASGRRFVWLLALAAGVLAIGGLGFRPQSLADLFLQMQGAGGTVAGRLEVWQRAIYMIQDFPFTGIGPGTFPQVLAGLYQPFLSSPNELIPHAHQTLLQAAVDFGIPGLIAFVALMTSLFVVGLANVFQADRRTRMLAAGIFAGFIVYLVHGLVDSVTVSPKPTLVLWTIAGLIVAQWRLVMRKPLA